MNEMLKLTFESDWHVGSGAGIPGSVDRQVLRNTDELPYIPGKTLTGILRDAAEWIAHTKDRNEGNEEGRWSEALLSLFGEQPERHGGNENKVAKEAALGVSSARFSDGLLDTLRDPKHKRLIPLLYILQPGVKIDPGTGRSLDKHLFSTEKVRKGCALYAPLRIEGELGENERTLLEEAVKAVRRLGGNRRRGSGRCRLELIPKNETPRSEKPNDLPGKINDPDSFVTLNYRLTTLEPVIVNRATLGNVSETETIIPGNSLMSYFTNNIMEDFDREEMRSAIMDGSISVGDFPPEFEDGPSYPVPLSFGERKDNGEILNRLLEVGEEGKQVKDLRSGFVNIEGKVIRYRTSGEVKILRTHNTVEDKKQRPTDVGGLFFYEAIKEGQTFSGALKIKGSIWNELSVAAKERLKFFETKIGRSRKDEYGGVSLEFLSSENAAKESSPLIHDKYLVVYLLSDVLIRGEFLEYSARLEDLKKALEKALGLTLSEEEWRDEKSPLGGERGHCLRAGRRESWHTNWTLPRPSLVYFQAGSVLLYKVNNPGDWNEETVLRAMDEGIGDRRAEGYGRIWINPPFLCETGFDVQPEKKAGSAALSVKADTGKLDSDDKKFVEFLETEYHKKCFSQAARQSVYNSLRGQSEKETGLPSLKKEEYCPSTSQLGGLREAAAFIRYGTGNDSELLKKWLKKKEDQEKWDKDFLKWIKSIVAEPELIWKNIGLEFPKDSELDQETLKIFGLCAFIDILCEGIFENEKNKNQEGTE